MFTRALLTSATAVATVLAVSGCSTSTVEPADSGHHISDIRPADPKSKSVGGSRVAANSGHSAHHPDGGRAHAKIDAYAAAVRRQLKATYGHSFANLYSAIRVVPVYPGGLRFVYVFKNYVDAAAAASRLRTTVPVLQAAFTSQFEPAMKAHGFAHPSATWTYLNPDGSFVWSYTS